MKHWQWLPIIGSFVTMYMVRSGDLDDAVSTSDNPYTFFGSALLHAVAILVVALPFIVQ